jgi:hypothetical protein
VKNSGRGRLLMLTGHTLINYIEDWLALRDGDKGAGK